MRETHLSLSARLRTAIARPENGGNTLRGAVALVPAHAWRCFWHGCCLRGSEDLVNLLLELSTPATEDVAHALDPFSMRTSWRFARRLISQVIDYPWDAAALAVRHF